MKSIDHLGGRVVTIDELRRVEAKIGLSVPAALAFLLTGQPLVGLTLELDEGRDESGLGADFRWMTPDEVIDEATAAYPGIVATRKGFLPVGICLIGSGDPYFLRLEDGAIVRIPHAAASENDLDVRQVERVAASIGALLDAAEIIAPGGT